MTKKSRITQPSNSKTGLPNDGTHAFSLLEAAPFLLQGGKRFIWHDASLCKGLLRLKNGSLPKTAQDWSLRLSPEDNRKRNAALRKLTWDGARYAIRYQLLRGDARFIWVEERGERLSGDDKSAAEIAGVIINIDAAKKDQSRAAYKASHDELTGLWSMAKFSESLDQICAYTQSYKLSAICLQLRVNSLANINQIYGYEQGNSLLKDIASRLEGLLRTPDIIARVSGDCFGVGLHLDNIENIETEITRLQEALSDKSYASPHGPLKVEFTAAYVRLGEQVQTGLQAIEHTSSALQNTSHSDVMAAPITLESKTPSRRATTADDILTALNDRRISLAFQPIIDTKTRELHHYECLLRLRTDEGQIISAGSFIMASERLGLVHLLDRRALELAGEALRLYPDIHMALNVSAATVKDLGTAEAYIAALKALGPDVKRVSLELTETVALEDPAMASRFSVEARGLGCEFAIDDFGSGYTTFQNLMAIEADMIKIDGSFIEGIAHTPHKETFVRMMVDLAQTFGVKTVAEMVDSRADAELLKRLGVDYLQGYMFGVPSAAPAWRSAS